MLRIGLNTRDCTDMEYSAPSDQKDPKSRTHSTKPKTSPGQAVTDKGKPWQLQVTLTPFCDPAGAVPSPQKLCFPALFTFLPVFLI